MKWESIWLKRKISVKAFSAYTDLNELFINANSESNLVTDSFHNRVMRFHTPPVSAYPNDEASGVFVYAGDLEPRHFSPSDDCSGAHTSHSASSLAILGPAPRVSVFFAPRAPEAPERVHLELRKELMTLLDYQM